MVGGGVHSNFVIERDVQAGHQLCHLRTDALKMVAGGCLPVSGNCAIPTTELRNQPPATSN
jgi:hypothetical protein